MKKILCPTDLSEAAQNGVAYAAKIAQVTGAQLVLFNVQSVAAMKVEAMVSGRSEQFDSIEKEMESMSYQIARTFHISCYSKTQPSALSLEKTISEFAQDYDLVIMGTNGPDDIFQFLMGSHAYRACVKAKVPVMLIPEKCNYSEIRNVVYAFDYLKERKLPLTQLKPWIKNWEADLSVLQVLEEAYSQEVEDEVRELQFISKVLYADDINLKFETVRSYEIAQSIHSYMLRNKPDVLALCTVHRSLLERLFHNSLIQNIAGIATYPVFVFHE